jgi:hypothetical protein
MSALGRPPTRPGAIGRVVGRNSIPFDPRTLARDRRRLGKRNCEDGESRRPMRLDARFNVRIETRITARKSKISTGKKFSTLTENCEGWRRCTVINV